MKICVNHVILEKFFLPGHALTGIPVISVDAFLGSVAAESPGALATLEPLRNSWQESAELRSVDGQAHCRHPHGRMGSPLKPLLAMVSHCTFPAVGAPLSLPVAS
jgi:hypothetical protein